MRAGAEGFTPVERYGPNLQVVCRGHGYQRHQRAWCPCVQHDELSVRCGCGQQCAGRHTRVAPVYGCAKPGLTGRLRACVCALAAVSDTVPTTVKRKLMGAAGRRPSVPTAEQGCANTQLALSETHASAAMPPAPPKQPLLQQDRASVCVGG